MFPWSKNMEIWRCAFTFSHRVSHQEGGKDIVNKVTFMAARINKILSKDEYVVI